MSESMTGVGRSPTGAGGEAGGAAPGSMVPIAPGGVVIVAGGGLSLGAVVEVRERSPRFWTEPYFVWMVSAAFHLALIVAAALIFVRARRAMLEDDQQQIVIPNSFTDPSLSPGGPDMRQAAGSSEDPGQVAQDRLHDLLRSEGWAQAAGTENPSSFLQGADAGKDPFIIARGGAGSVGNAGADSEGQGGNLAPWGALAGGKGGGGAPNTSFYGTGGAAKRIVYILDHSGSMISNFDYLQREATRSVRNLVPIQFFSVIMVSETAETVGGNELERATPAVKEQFASKILDFRAEGQNDDLLPPFQDAFTRAFAMKPELIYFLTDGHFDPALLDVIAKLNKDHKVRINTIAFVAHDPSYEQQLQDLAKRNGGVYKFVAAKDLGQ
ncbi:MAG TPA: vWA domain-containing protein [Phycisphaerae bacterium]|nr:vWA domain-containing protein [Phycisphaerae bacterium]